MYIKISVNEGFYIQLGNCMQLYTIADSCIQFAYNSYNTHTCFPGSQASTVCTRPLQRTHGTRAIYPDLFVFFEKFRLVQSTGISMCDDIRKQVLTIVIFV